MTKKRNFIASSLILASLLSGCGLYKKKSPPVVLREYRGELEGVELTVKPFGKKDAEERFGKYTKRYKVLELLIENNNDHYFILHPWYVGQTLESPKKVAKYMHSNTLLVVWGMIGAGLFGLEWLAPLAPFLYLSVPTGIWLSNRNKDITKNVTRDSIYRNVESIIIPPYGQLKRHFFVSRYDFTPNFTITLLSGRDNKPVRFNIALASSKAI